MDKMIAGWRVATIGPDKILGVTSPHGKWFGILDGRDDSPREKELYDFVVAIAKECGSGV